MLPKVQYADLTDEHRAGVVLWGEVNEEHLRYDDLDQAIENYLDGWWRFDEDARKDETMLTFAGHKRMEMPKADNDAEWVLEFMLERWDEDLGDPDEATKPNEVMRAAAVLFVEVIQNEYKPWSCEPIIEIIVPVRAWVEQHAPEWLKESDDD